MLATLVIGLREGLEASLIVGIIAAFLRRTGKPLKPMWFGVGVAVALSIAVGLLLEFVSAELPQAQQEGMESVIGLIAVAVVTGMIAWMNTHARNMKAELEAHAASAVKDGTAWALVVMAFLAVLKEGFETSVFLLAAFQSSTSALAAGAGAVIGIAISVGIGIGIFRGGVTLNLGRFFRITGLFLVFVAAGLVLSSLRTAHEAGWILIGQQRTVDLTWLAPAGSVQAALLTGVLGIPADPRLIEVLGWAIYLVATLTYLLWPAKKRPTGTAVTRLRFTLAGAFALVAVVLAVAVPLPGAYSPAPAQLAGGGTAKLTTSGSRLSLASSHGTTAYDSSATKTTSHDDVAANVYDVVSTPTTTTSTLTLTKLVELSGGRLPIGFSAAQNPGPFTASTVSHSTTTIWTASGVLLDASKATTNILTLTDGGLVSSRTISLTGAQGTDANWRVVSSYPTSVAAGIAARNASRSELLLWKLWLPLALLIAATVLLIYALRGRFRRTAHLVREVAARPRPEPASVRA
jgi:high-affinity iron transporter